MSAAGAEASPVRARAIDIETWDVSPAGPETRWGPSDAWRAEAKGGGGGKRGCEKAGRAGRGRLLVGCLSPPSCSPHVLTTPLGGGGGISLQITTLMIGLGQQREAGTWHPTSWRGGRASLCGQLQSGPSIWGQPPLVHLLGQASRLGFCWEAGSRAEGALSHPSGQQDKPSKSPSQTPKLLLTDSHFRPLAGLAEVISVLSLCLGPPAWPSQGIHSGRSVFLYRAMCVSIVCNHLLSTYCVLGFLSR